MSKKTEIKEQVISQMIENTEREIERNNILIGFYEKHAETVENEEDKAKVLLKAKQITDNNDFNEKFLKHIKSL